MNRTGQAGQAERQAADVAAGAVPVRIGAAAATLAVHALALLAALAAAQHVPPGPARRAERLTVFTPQTFRPPAPPPGTGHPPPRRPERQPLRDSAAAAARIVTAAQPASSAPVPAPTAARTPAPASAASAPRAALPEPAPRPSPTPAENAPAHSALASYRQQLWSHIAARRPRGLALAGTVEVRFRLDGSGGLLSAEVTGSSGNALLDRIALRTVRTAAPFPAPPAALGEGQRSFTIQFRLH